MNQWFLYRKWKSDHFWRNNSSWGRFISIWKEKKAHEDQHWHVLQENKICCSKSQRMNKKLYKLCKVTRVSSFSVLSQCYFCKGNKRRGNKCVIQVLGISFTRSENLRTTASKNLRFSLVTLVLLISYCFLNDHKSCAENCPAIFSMKDFGFWFLQQLFIIFPRPVFGISLKGDEQGRHNLLGFSFHLRSGSASFICTCRYSTFYEYISVASAGSHTFFWPFLYFRTVCCCSQLLDYPFHVHSWTHFSKRSLKWSLTYSFEFNFMIGYNHCIAQSSRVLKYLNSWTASTGWSLIKPGKKE